MRRITLFTVLLTAVLISLSGCAAKKPRPWVDLDAIRENITKDAAKPAIIDAVETNGEKEDKTGSRVRDFSSAEKDRNMYLDKVAGKGKKSPRLPDKVDGIQLNFDNADIYEVIQVITETLQINYIVDPAVKGVVNIRSGEKIPPKKLYTVFQKILHINGLDIRNEGDYYYIYPAKKTTADAIYGADQTGRLKESPRMIHQIIPVVHIAAGGVAKLLEPYLSDQGSLYMLPDQNILIVADFESKVLDILMILARLDVSPLANLNVRLIRVDEAPLFTLRDELIEILKALRL